MYYERPSFDPDGQGYIIGKYLDWYHRGGSGPLWLVSMELKSFLHNLRGKSLWI